MIRQSTIDKLHDMRLSAMSDAFERQCADPGTYQSLSFEDRFAMLVDREWDKRKPLNIMQTEILTKGRCWNFPPAGIFQMTTISF